MWINQRRKDELSKVQAKQLHLVSWQWSWVSLSTPIRNVERADLVQGGTSWAKQAERSVSKVVTEKWAQLDLAHNMLDNDHKKCANLFQGERMSWPGKQGTSVRWWQKNGHSSTLRIISQQTKVIENMLSQNKMRRTRCCKITKHFLFAVLVVGCL